MAVPLWLGAYAEGLGLPTKLATPIWHAHEMVFGYAAATVAGFLLTAIPNWTGRMPLQGGPLATLVLLWVIGRDAQQQPEAIPPGSWFSGDDVEAEEAVHDGYVNAFTHLDGFRGGSSLATWLARIVSNEALGRLRRRRPTVDIGEMAETLADAGPFATAAGPCAAAEPCATPAARMMINHPSPRTVATTPPRAQ